MTLFVVHNAVLTISAAALSVLSRDKLYAVLLIGADCECETFGELFFDVHHYAPNFRKQVVSHTLAKREMWYCRSLNPQRAPIAKGR